MAKAVIAAEIGLDSKQAEQSVGSFRTQLRAATQELVTMSEKFGLSSTEAQNAAKKVAGLKDAIGDAKQLADTFNPDKKFVALGGAIQGVTAGFSAFTGAMGLFGAKGEEVEKILLKVQSAMALQQGLSGIAGAVDSFKMLGNTIKGNVVKAFSTLKGAIIGTGIGALVVGVGLLIANFESVKKAVLNFIPGLAKVGEVISNIVDWFTDLVGITSEAERAQQRYIESVEKGIRQQQDLLDSDAGHYDDYTKKKIQAKLDYNKKVVELDKDETRSDQEKQALLRAYAEKTNATIDAADKERYQKQSDAREAAYNKAKALQDKADAEAAARKAKLDAEAEAERQSWVENALKKIDDEIEIEQIRFENAEALRIQNDEVNAEIAAKKKAQLEEDLSEQMYYDQLDLDNKAANVKAKKELHDIELQQQSDLVDGIAGALDTLADIAGKQTTAGKVLSIAVTTINTIKGAISAFTGMTQQIPGPVGIALGVVAAAGVVAAGVKAVKQITAVKIPRGGGGGTSAPSISLPAAPLTPQAQTTRLDQQSINQVGNAANRAYVLETDVSGNQERITRLNRAARIN